MERALLELIELLDAYQEGSWADGLRVILASSQSAGVGVAAGMIKGIFGGSGSFNDLVLHQNGRPVRQANDRLDVLRRLLFDEASTVRS